MKIMTKIFRSLSPDAHAKWTFESANISREYMITTIDIFKNWLRFRHVTSSAKVCLLETLYNFSLFIEPEDFIHESISYQQVDPISFLRVLKLVQEFLLDYSAIRVH